MAFGLGKLGSLGGGIAGFAVGGPAGALIGAGAGGALGGMFEGTPRYTSPSFADIDLKTANPLLWAQLEKMNSSVQEAERLYNERRQGPTAQEQRMQAGSRQNLQEQLASRGLLGTSAGASTEVDAENRIREAILERAYREQQDLFGNLSNQRSGYANAISAAQGQVMNPLMQAQQLNFQAKQNENQAQNQLYSGLLSGGLSIYGNQQNIDAMKDMRRPTIPSPYYGGTPSIYPGLV